MSQNGKGSTRRPEDSEAIRKRWPFPEPTPAHKREPSRLPEGDGVHDFTDALVRMGRSLDGAFRELGKRVLPRLGAQDVKGKSFVFKLDP